MMYLTSNNNTSPPRSIPAAKSRTGARTLSTLNLPSVATVTLALASPPSRYLGGIPLSMRCSITPLSIRRWKARENASFQGCRRYKHSSGMQLFNLIYS